MIRPSDLVVPARAALAEGGLRLLCRKLLRYPFGRLLLIGARRDLRLRVPACRTVDDVLDLAFGFKYGRFTVEPSQIRSELKSFLDLLDKSPPQIVVEIGTGQGGTFMALAHVARSDAILITVDPAPGSPRERLLTAMARPTQSVHVLKRDSHVSSTHALIRKLVSPPGIDLLFVDGDHSESGVRRDFELYAPLLRAGGMIAFHDVVPGPYETVGGVPSFWTELKRDRKVREFVRDWGQGGLGIGVLIPEPDDFGAVHAGD